uniref:Uncharacterized protein n=1 Tax=Arion vulgaris TaxID=1028688 RepID=A0A0B7BX04_9EUPU
MNDSKLREPLITRSKHGEKSRGLRAMEYTRAHIRNSSDTMLIIMKKTMLPASS